MKILPIARLATPRAYETGCALASSADYGSTRTMWAPDEKLVRDIPDAGAVVLMYRHGSCLTYQALSCRPAAAGGARCPRFGARRYQRWIGTSGSRSAAAPCWAAALSHNGGNKADREAAMGWVGLGLLAAAGAAGVAIFGRLGLQHADAVLATVLRSVVMSAALVVIAGATGKFSELAGGRSELDTRAWLCVLGAGVCGAGSWLAYFAALKVAHAGPVAALDRLSLPLVFVLGVVLLGEEVGWRGWSGLALAVGGSYLIVWDQISRAAA